MTVNAILLLSPRKDVTLEPLHESFFVSFPINEFLYRIGFCAFVGFLTDGHISAQMFIVHFHYFQGFKVRGYRGYSGAKGSAR